MLIFEARKERRVSFEYNPTPTWWDQKALYADYTSASINTRGKFTFTYGRLEVRAKIPTSKGAWPAIWLLGTANPWPQCGEIDVMEYEFTYPVNRLLGIYTYEGAFNRVKLELEKGCREFGEEEQEWWTLMFYLEIISGLEPCVENLIKMGILLDRAMILRMGI